MIDLNFLSDLTGPTYFTIRLPIAGDVHVVNAQLYNFGNAAIERIKARYPDASVLVIDSSSDSIPGLIDSTCTAAGKVVITTDMSEELDYLTTVSRVLKNEYNVAVDVLLDPTLRVANIMIYTQEHIETMAEPMKLQIDLPDDIAKEMAYLAAEKAAAIQDAEFDQDYTTPNDEDCSICVREDCPFHPIHDEEEEEEDCCGTEGDDEFSTELAMIAELLRFGKIAGHLN